MTPAEFNRKLVYDIISDYWREYYCDYHCTLCGNHGIVDTTGVTTPAGTAVGRRQYCFCPNGQLMRKNKVVL